ncbi:MAG: 2-oxoglutarate dehydrogenase E1 component [Bacteroidia bacterium]|nr:2-oxoglutarate dehydrogenase E1 component [Bacteroidia bacterium]
MSGNLSYLSNADGAYVQNMYEQYLQEPESVEFGWRKFFEGFEFARTNYGEAPQVPHEGVLKEINVLNLIHAYRQRGHLFTNTNPVRERRKYSPTLDIANFGLDKSDLETVFHAGNEVGIGPAPLKAIVALLEKTYCESIGAETDHLRSPEMVDWFTSRMEKSRNTPDFTLEQRKHILKKLNQAVAFETFLGSKYVGQKRFSLEGAETLIPALDAIIEKGTDLGVEEFIIGMAHRGRLNVLANILGKTYDDIFSEFEGFLNDDVSLFEGDVKYHMGFGADVTTEKGDVAHISLCPNPSHLESVDPVAEGIARAKIDLKYNGDSSKLVPILIHGDAAVAAQGVVYEVVQMAELEAYSAGGTVHVVINNQVGFTTNYLDARTSTYCTDVAKITRCPIFHVNGDDVEALVFAIELAMEFRQEFKKDVFIDLLCYRRHGHNEADEPRFTQPTLYKAIENHKDPREIYFDRLMKMGGVEANLAREMEKSFKRFLQERLKEVKQAQKTVEYGFDQSGWSHIHVADPGAFEAPVKTAVELKKLKPIAEKLVNLPSDKVFYEKIEKIFENRKTMLETDKLDWALGELLAYATLVTEGYNVRVSGQDVERGTFAHRHAVLRVNNTEDEYVPLQHVAEGQGKFEIFNSLLSEYAVLGFEYGYSWSAPDTLVIWEAQFGDFVNGAQIIIDQYISSAQTKWKRFSGLTMFLPHGFEGQGPEHSSARMERFLELCAANNMIVANPTTPANHFHLLRRQLIRPFRTPLIVFTPKSLLRHPQAVSPLSDFSDHGFQEILDDNFVPANGKGVKKVLLCNGKIFYELLAQQTESNRKDVAIVRMEQLYPLPMKQLEKLFAKYKGAKWVWVQEEPSNMGAWPFILRHFREFKPEIDVISRKENSSPATGYKKQHESQQQYIVNRSFDIVPDEKVGNGKAILAQK